jgi:ribose/xylose/arabinose/galactoside ABC-type transport system permease subunit
MLFSVEEEEKEMRRSLLSQIRKYNILFLLLGLFTLLAISSKNFISPHNIENILMQVSTDGIVAIGMTFVIITGGIDLSVGKVLALSSVIAIGLQPYTGSWISCTLALLAGALLGTINGLLISKVKINPFITTLGIRIFVEGLTLGVTNTRPISGKDPSFLNFASTSILGIPLPALIFLGMIIIFHYFLSYTCKGRLYYAVGGNKEASWLAGIKVDKYLIMGYAFCSFCAALAGVIWASRINTGSPIIGKDTDTIAIVAVLLGEPAWREVRELFWGHFSVS